MKAINCGGYQKLATTSCFISLTSMLGFCASQAEIMEVISFGSTFHVMEKYGLEIENDWTRMNTSPVNEINLDVAEISK